MLPGPPPGWTERLRIPGIQLRLPPGTLAPVGPVDARPLGDGDVPAMMDLVALTEPGPFSDRTIEMGRYAGVFDGDRLVAMAGERLHPEGRTEISAVCTHPDGRGRGLASGLVGQVVAGIERRGEEAFIHVAVANTAALRLYEHLGFARRRFIDFALFQAPASYPGT